MTPEEVSALVARLVGKVADEMRDYITSTVLPTHIVLDVWERKLRRAMDDITAQAQALTALRDSILTYAKREPGFDPAYWTDENCALLARAYAEDSEIMDRYSNDDEEQGSKAALARQQALTALREERDRLKAQVEARGLMPPINADGHALVQFRCDRCAEFMSRRVSCPDCDAALTSQREAQ